GGYCFELNGLFLQALQHFGFEARALLARVHLRGEPSGRTHQLSLIEIAGREWVADVGFGASTPRAPMLFELNRIREVDGRRCRLVAAEPWGTMLQQDGPEGWENLYSFDLMHVCPADIATGNHFTSTHPETHFTKMRMANLPTERGRLSLADFVLTEVVDGESRSTRIPDSDEYLGVLERRFGIKLDAGYGDLKPVGGGDDVG
ncbi:MAG: arylamine N-acetyltransferase, partial [Dehalococcoidia bacterium]